MPLEEVLFAVPIYSKSYDQFLVCIKKRQKELQRNKIARLKKWGFDEQTFSEGMQGKRFYTKGWKYNLIVGWLEFYLNGKTIKAQYWLVTAKKISINLTNKIFEEKGKICDVSPTHTKTNSEIGNDIQSFLRKLQQGSYISCFKNYYIDSTAFLEFIKFLDIKGLIESKQ